MFKKQTWNVEKLGITSSSKMPISMNFSNWRQLHKQATHALVMQMLSAKVTNVLAKQALKTMIAFV
jgi:hypothetical protein